jgi:HAD superfamily hydrolase (TIGR01549 family)
MPLSPAPSPRLTTVLFDLDDTLFDHTATSRAALWATTCELPFFTTVAFEPFYQFYSCLLEELHLRVLAGTCSYPEARRLRFEGLLARYQPAATPADAARLADAYYVQYPRQRQPVPGALALLQALRPHYRIGIITNNRTAEQADKLRFLQMTELVDALITSEDVGVPKPDPRIFHAALQQLEARPEETVLVGDNWHADVLGALAVGIRPLWLNRLGTPRPLAAVAEITSLEPLSAVLTQIAGAPAGAGRVILTQ